MNKGKEVGGFGNRCRFSWDHRNVQKSFANRFLFSKVLCRRHIFFESEKNMGKIFFWSRSRVACDMHQIPIDTCADRRMIFRVLFASRADDFHVICNGFHAIFPKPSSDAQRRPAGPPARGAVGRVFMLMVAVLMRFIRCNGVRVLKSSRKKHFLQPNAWDPQLEHHIKKSRLIVIIQQSTQYSRDLKRTPCQRPRSTTPPFHRTTRSKLNLRRFAMIRTARSCR